MASKLAAAKLIKYVGLRTPNFGRPIWEIVLNLKNFGIGRYVTRTTLSERYPEPTFYKILSVQPEVIEYPEKMRGTLWTEVTFRGRKLNEPVNLGLIGWKDDFQLVHKHEESNLLTLDGKPLYLEPTQILPRTAKLPPLWKEIIRREKLTKGLPVEQNEPDPELDLIYNHSTGFIRVAEKGQEPTIKIGPGQFKTNNSHLYDDVIWNREEAIAKYNNLKPVEPTKGHSKFQLTEEILSGEFLNK